MNVHDSSSISYPHSLKLGVVMTMYILSSSDVPKRYGGLGLRIEDAVQNILQVASS